MHPSQILLSLGFTAFALSPGISAAAVKEAIPEEHQQPQIRSLDLDKRDSQCNPASCASAISAASGTGILCTVAGPATVACVGAVNGVVAGVINFCYHCAIITECTPGDQQAIDAACGTPDTARAQLGPNQCVQLSSSVPSPSDTDHVLEGGYTIHCHNTANIVTLSHGPCSFPCKNCSQCNDWPNKRDSVAMIGDAFEA